VQRTVTLDIECFIDYFLVKFRDVVTGKTRHFEMFEGQELDLPSIKRVLLSCRIVTFNGTNYDLPILMYAFAGNGCAALKRATDTIIHGGDNGKGMRGWQFEQQFNVKVWTAIDHIDLMEVAPGVMVSLKQYGGRMHSKLLQDLPFDHDASITPEQRPVVVDYCGNDHITTADLWHWLTRGKDDVIAIRERIGADLGIDLRSKSDAQMAEAAIRREVEKLKGEKIFKPEISAGTRYRYKAPAFLSFRTEQMQTVLANICSADFIVKGDGKIAEPAVLDGLTVSMGTSVYAMGIGGLHSCEKSTAHFADDDLLLVDRDVASFYPMLIKMCGLAPRNMGPLFTRVYSAWIDKRIAAKRAGDTTTAQTLKIFLNGIFGKLGSRFSIVYAPDLLIQVTLTGQLVLLMLIEALELAGIPVVSANTDGIVIKCPKAMKDICDSIIAKWERSTGLETEETQYKALFSRDINNYIALKKSGGYKAKGAFTAAGLQKNPTNEICNIAVARFLEHGVPLAHTITSCDDVRKFLTVRQVNGGGTYDGEYLGRVVRWVYGLGETRDIRYRKANPKTGTHNKVAGSDGAMPLMTLPDEVPLLIDYDRYIKEANDILNDVGFRDEHLQNIRLFPNYDLFF
jgi:hypothetical protein